MAGRHQSGHLVVGVGGMNLPGSLGRKLKRGLLPFPFWRHENYVWEDKGIGNRIYPQGAGVEPDSHTYAGRAWL
jgi:hypothetical protein